MDKKDFMKVLHEESLNDWSLDMLKGGAGSRDCTNDICTNDDCTDNVCNSKTCYGNTCSNEVCNKRIQCTPKTYEPPVNPCGSDLCDPHTS